MMDAKMTEICYQIVCEFEKSFLEHFKEQEDGKIAFFSFDLEDTNRQFPTQSLTYTSYKNLFEEQYKDAFLTSIASLDEKELRHTLGTGTLETMLAKDAIIRMQYEEITKERDVDNDGTPDRIDIDDTKNAVQTVGDLNKIKNATSKEIQEENERRTGKKTKNNRHDRGL
ncbi:hypothetical protein ACT7DC_02040 [Bacillus cereus]